MKEPGTILCRFSCEFKLSVVNSFFLCPCTYIIRCFSHRLKVSGLIQFKVVIDPL
jgi:hypothetical protein